eukprot:5319076-Pyramimonas_sp.AAC.1
MVSGLPSGFARGQMSVDRYVDRHGQVEAAVDLGAHAEEWRLACDADNRRRACEGVALPRRFAM